MYRKALARFALAALLLAALPAQSASVDLATLPLTSGVGSTVAPNIYFILDDSSSMDYDYMPDDVGDDDDRNCFKNHGYNTIYYNPATTYEAPKGSDGISFDDALTEFDDALINGYNAASGTTDLSETSTQNVSESVSVNLGNNPFATTNNSSNVTVTHNNHGLASGTRVTFSGAPARGSTNNVDLNGNFTISNVTANTYRITTSRRANRTGSTGGANVVATFTRITSVEVANYGWYEYQSAPAAPPSTCAADGDYIWRWPSNAAEERNFTNWYSYYRTRLLMMKTATGRAFADVGDKFRVGYSAISYTGSAAASTRFLKFGRFDDAHKATWYSRLYGAGCASGTCYTPLRGALSKAGRLYAGRVLVGNDDPVQYSCQKNYTILTTDGYWNTNQETATYTAKREDNVTNVGDQDGLAGTVRPFYEAGQYSNSLADIAMYYYKSDLRPAGSLGGLNDEGVRVDVSQNNVPGSAADPAIWQHMTTFTLGLGVSGTLGYAEDYQTGGSADYNAILAGTKNWPDPASANTATKIDDLWHAAVNGRGQYLSAGNPDALVSALQRTLATIEAEDASAAAAATSSLEPVAGDNFAYVAQYTTVSWHGDLQARDIDLADGSLAAEVTWSARDRLAAKLDPDDDSREIYAFDSTAASKLKTFESANLAAEIAAGYFKSDATNPRGALSQFATWTDEQKASATSEAMIAFLRGRSGFEDQAANADDVRLFRDRVHALGDIVNTAPVFVKKPPFKYTDNDYLAFATANMDREGTVYVGANDGMLHAFDAETGDERWAYIPSVVMPQMFNLADADYGENHRFFVDGPITVGDAYDGADWRTILIGGLGRGGRAFYALDVTDPDNPKALWEFGTGQDADMGYSYGNALLTKRESDGRWVVLIASGYNNNAGGDSKGRLFVLDAITGAKLAEIITDNGVADPDVSGIAKITNWVLDTLANNTTQYVYGGDLGGSLWRFDISANTSQKLGRTSATVGNQPITMRPEVARMRDGAGNFYRVVYFGTGRYLGFDDLAVDSTSSTVAQAMYAVKDTGGDLGVLTSAGANLVAQTLDTSGDDDGDPRTIPNPVAVDWQLKNGWYLALPIGERLNVDMKLQLGTLVAISNEPITDYCVPDGRSWLYALDYKTGAAVLGQQTRAVGFPVGNSIATGVTLVRLPTNKLVAIVTQADTNIRAMSIPVAPSAATGVRRMGWREIF